MPTRLPCSACLWAVFTASRAGDIACFSGYFSLWGILLSASQGRSSKEFAILGTQIQDLARQFALEQPLAELVYPFGPEHEVFRVGGKIFMMITSKPGYPIVTLKTDPEENRVLQLAHPSIVGG